MSGTTAHGAYDSDSRSSHHPSAPTHTGIPSNAQSNPKQIPTKSQQMQTPRPVATPTASRPIGRDINQANSVVSSNPNTNANTSSGKRTKAKLDDFILLKTVGKGSFGKVVMVRYIYYISFFFSFFSLSLGLLHASIREQYFSFLFFSLFSIFPRL